jgi:HAD superfamily hydrolase (TIGR01484 family)
MINKKAIVCDLDGTLAESKSALTPEMADLICKVLKNHYFVVVSGGAFTQFQKQFISQLHCVGDPLENLSFFPTMGSTCYVYDKETAGWKQLYEEKLTDDERASIIKAFKEAMDELKIDTSGAYGEIIEDRGTQVTFSGCGQEAPPAVKAVWDPDRRKREAMVAIMQKKISGFDLRIGGMSSIDVTRVGIDKAYAVGKIKKLLNITDDDIVFLGDALYKGGNDSAVKKTGVDFIQPSNPEDSIEILEQYI